jgi:hypothetical protein
LPVKKKSELRFRHKLILYVAYSGLAFTGVAWYALSRPWLLAGHALFGFLMIFALGFMWELHVRKHWDGNRKRISGRALWIGNLVLTVSGYFLYYAGDEALRKFIGDGHWYLGLIGIPLLVYHVIAA